MSNAKRRCCHCKEYQLKDSGLIIPAGFFCNLDHAMAYGKKKGKAKRVKQERAEHRAAKVRLKTAGEYVKEAQASINAYVRIRDYGNTCICCGAQMNWHKLGGAVDAGHYRSRGAASHMRFNLFNIHAQSVKCNRFLSGNVVDYRINLIKKIGLAKVEAIECDNTPRKFTIEYLQRVKKIFNKKTRLYKRKFRDAGN
ncbi:MAG: recombination protein NinG [Immundisolibacteraceae bacterium]|nr:recombination protein NinG [Immundisolibacteraceae bacterium]